MGQPAARVGDTTAHGGVIAAGATNVLIGGMPAARAMDFHTCPMSTPGTPPVPHVGGPISKGSTGVLIGGMPAARIGDMAVCTGPPDSIVVGCTNVLIGETVAGGGGGVPQQTAATIGALTSAALAGNEPEPAETEDHFLHVTFKDTAGKLISGVNYEVTGPEEISMKGMLTGKIERHGVPEGQYEITLRAITAAYWSVREAREDTPVEMIVETVGFEDGAPVTLQVYERSINSPDRVIQTIGELTLESGQLHHTWDPPFGNEEEEDLSPGYRSPSFFFSATVGDLRERSGVLVYRDWIEIELLDEDDNPVPNEAYKLILSTGEVRTGVLSGEGLCREDNLPFGNLEIYLPNMDE